MCVGSVSSSYRRLQGGHAPLLSHRLETQTLNPCFMERVTCSATVRPTTDALSALLPSPWVHTTRAVSVSLLRLRGAPALTGACRAVAGAGSFVVDSGPCTVDSTATCFSSPNYQSTYGNLQQCFITAHEAVTLSVVAFSTESWYDELIVNGVQYSGTTGPGGVNSWRWRRARPSPSRATVQYMLNYLEIL